MPEGLALAMPPCCDITTKLEVQCRKLQERWYMITLCAEQSMATKFPGKTTADNGCPPYRRLIDRNKWYTTAADMEELESAKVQMEAAIQQWTAWAKRMRGAMKEDDGRDASKGAVSAVEGSLSTTVQHAGSPSACNTEARATEGSTAPLHVGGWSYPPESTAGTVIRHLDAHGKRMFEKTADEHLCKRKREHVQYDDVLRAVGVDTPTWGGRSLGGNTSADCVGAIEAWLKANINPAACKDKKGTTDYKKFVRTGEGPYNNRRSVFYGAKMK